MTENNLTGSMAAKRDWMECGEFNNPYPKGSKDYFDYSDEQYKIELIDDLNNELSGGFQP